MRLLLSLTLILTAPNGHAEVSSDPRDAFTCHVEFLKDDGEIVGHGSATVLSGDRLLSAAHVFADTGNGATRVRFTVGAQTVTTIYPPNKRSSWDVPDLVIMKVRGAEFAGPFPALASTREDWVRIGTEANEFWLSGCAPHATTTLGDLAYGPRAIAMTRPTLPRLRRFNSRELARGAHVGDSGGPALASVEGRPSLLGVIKRGRASVWVRGQTMAERWANVRRSRGRALTESWAEIVPYYTDFGVDVLTLSPCEAELRR